MLKRDVLRKEINVDHSISEWKAYDNVTLFSQTWQPQSANPKGVINLIHGLGEHSGRYDTWARLFVESGYIVRSFDLRGHGRSGGKRGYSSGLYKLLRDLDQFVITGRELYGGIPVINYGHSMGANLVLNHTIQDMTTADALIVTSPWLELGNPPSPFKILSASVLAGLLPGLTVRNGLRAEDLSHDLRIVHLYKNDPLVHNRIGLKLFSQLYESGIRASMSIYKINVPMLVMHGESDQITSCKASRNFVRNASSKTTYREFEGGYHELHNDLDNELVFDTIKSWLENTLPASK